MALPSLAQWGLGPGSGTTGPRELPLPGSGWQEGDPGLGRLLGAPEHALCFPGPTLALSSAQASWVHPSGCERVAVQVGTAFQTIQDTPGPA